MRVAEEAEARAAGEQLAKEYSAGNSDPLHPIPDCSGAEESP